MINCCRGIALSFGYVESNTTSWLVYCAENKYPATRKEALHSLTAYLWDKFLKEKEETKHFIDLYKADMAKCCQSAWLKRDYDNPPTNCPVCQASYQVKKEDTFSVSEWHQFLHDIHSSTCDSYGEHDWPENPDGWTPWMFKFNVPQNQMLIIPEYAEYVLTEALSELHPELKDKLDPDDLESFPDPSEDWRDYHSMLDESTVYLNHGYGHLKDENELVMVEEGVAKLQKKTKRFSETITHDYPNGGQSIMVDGRYTYIKYNTGDQIWLDYIDGVYQVTQVISYDGVNWNEKFGKSIPLGV